MGIGAENQVKNQVTSIYEAIDELCGSVSLPKMYTVQQRLCDEKLFPEQIPDSVRAELFRAGFQNRIHAGQTIAITCGSRGVANIALIIRSIVSFVKERGAKAFVFPAMGSHGGATAEGQRAILTSYGVTEDFIGCPIKATMQTVQIGTTEEGLPVFIDRYASEADGIILCGRIKAHTGFRGPYESGLMKMAVIGMGKQHGAETVHESGFSNLGRILPQVGNVILNNVPVIGGLAVIENAFDETNRVEAVLRENIPLREPELLLEAKQKMGRLFLNRTDVLVVDQIGKDISGDGMDPNITGTYADPSIMDVQPEEFHAQRIAVLDLTPESHGNYTGVGMSSVTTQRLVSKAVPELTYPNTITSTVLCEIKIPLTAANDRQAVQVCVQTCNGIDKKNPRIIRIHNTAAIGTILVSEACLADCEANENLEVLSGPVEWPFDADGNLF